jgi:phenylpyruvate tautomerase PptA (4-oxalocrotonate tautomerase family)
VLRRSSVRLAELEEPSHAIGGRPGSRSSRALTEGDVAADTVQPPDSHAPIVEILAFTGRSPEVIEALIAAVADTLVTELHLAPGNVFITWTELQAGRVFTGGEIRR